MQKYKTFDRHSIMVVLSKTKLKKKYIFKKKICMIFTKSFFLQKSYLFKINICIPPFKKN